MFTRATLGLPRTRGHRKCFSDARARWRREAGELGATIGAENVEGAPELTEVDVVGKPGQELVARYDDWRRRWVVVAGEQEWRPHQVAQDRLWFRGGYGRKEWAGFVLYKSPAGYVVSRVTAERRAIPSTVVEAVFSASEDAGKYIIARIGDWLRMKIGATPLAQSWKSIGADVQLTGGEPADDVVDYIAGSCGVASDMVRKSVRCLSVGSDPVRCAVLGRGSEEFSGVLLLSYDDLDASLSEGLPRRSGPEDPS